MRIRHLVDAANVDAEGFVIDPHKVRHGLIHAERVADLAGAVEPLTHLNLDFPEHRLDTCLVVERLERGARVLCEGDQFLFAQVRPACFKRLGPVLEARRRAEWQAAFEKRRAHP